MNTNAIHTNQSIIPAVGRILLAIIFVFSGVGKVLGAEGYLAYIAASGLPFPMLALVVAIVLEIGGGLMLAFGYRTRLAAAVLAAFSVVTAFAFHSAIGDQNQLIHLLKNIAMAGGLLQVVAFGAGAWSLDAAAGRKALPLAA